MDLDSDGDGIKNHIDKCPFEFGVIENSGCPFISNKLTEQVVRIANEINFVTNQAVLLTSSKTKLNELITILVENPDFKVIVSGHTDDVGTEESNFILSERRALSVEEYLMEKGIAKGRITVLAFGEQQLKQNDFTDDARAKNRRVEIKLIK